MLGNLNLKLIFEKSNQLGFSQCRIYAERTLTTHVEIQDKDQRSHVQESGGISLELTKTEQNNPLTLRTNQFSTEAILTLLEVELSPSEASEVSVPTNFTNGSLGKKMETLQRLVRKINLDNSLQKPIHFRYQDQKQLFQVCSHPDKIESGETNVGEVKVDVISQFRGKNLEFTQEICSTNLDDFERQLQALPEQIQKRIFLGSTERWPLPSGELPVGWSAQAIAKLTDCFIRGFEGDLVLRDFSFLCDSALPFNFNFSLQEANISTTVVVDHEGLSRKPVVIFDGKKPRTLATDSWVAKEFEVDSTGHSRRASFDSPSSIGFWHPVLKGHQETDSVLHLMEKGIWIEEIEIQELDLISGDITLHISQANLVHQSQIGESIEPFSWTLCLSDFMGSLTHFNKDGITNGFFHTKQKQRIFTEYTTPAGLSSVLNLPGTVPQTHYW